MLKQRLDNVRSQGPLIHNITNYVTVNDCANILLACGASPIMADDTEEVEEITSLCKGLNINIGTLNKNTIPSMILAGKKSNLCGHPVILDPVGAGASSLRSNTAKKLLKEIKFTVIKGNISEIKTLAMGTDTTCGVDANIADIVTKNNLDEVIKFAREFAYKTGAIIAITGAIDIVTDDKKTFIIHNGTAMMGKITGTGCMLSAMTCAYLVANKDNLLEATVASVCAMGIAGERAYARLKKEDGNSSYRNYLIDEIYNLNGELLEGSARYEVR
ncbi:hydroxyethylthiazole kinase [Hathewaya proteolytica DSM 3090]|uniref:Hydroxyethylthiazole kinase n=1 Tax=Hathewaya proteolytica DSM 3090 TaxID=1121331 RepID=A0A1M6NZD1_9CLOT|nr:hydroxyethylthiazole kinase [Hathewaya proteolytica]SHK00992.1 hydroxyethylthiazole kinase [Hathewaya proteolytica DSM 3090]